MHCADSKGETGTKKLLRSFYQYFWASGTIKLDGDFGSTGGNIHGNRILFYFLDTHVSLAPTHLRCPLVRPLVILLNFHSISVSGCST